MLASLYEWMKNIIVFMIFTTVILNLLGKNNYKKYVGLVTGLLLVLLVVTPLLNLTGKKDYLDFSLDSYGSLVLAEDLSYELFSMEGNADTDILKEYKQVLYSQTERLLNEKGLSIETVSFDICEDKSSKEFGTVQAIIVQASYLKNAKEEETVHTVENIDQVKIDEIIISKEKAQKAQEGKKGLSAMEISIKNTLADFYNINSNNINITIREDHDGERG